MSKKDLICSEKNKAPRKLLRAKWDSSKIQILKLAQGLQKLVQGLQELVKNTSKPINSDWSLRAMSSHSKTIMTSDPRWTANILSYKQSFVSLKTAITKESFSFKKATNDFF